MAARLQYPLVFVFSACAAWTACGEGGGEDIIEEELEVAVREGAPSERTVSAMSALEASAAVEALGTDDRGRVLAVAGSMTYEVGANTLDARALYAGPGEPTGTGRVYSVVPKMDGGAWIAAESGLFILDTLYVVYSPLMVGAGALRGVSQVEAGPLAGLWVSGDAGLFRSRAPMLEKYPLTVLGGAAGAIDAVAVQKNGNAALVLAGGKLAVLEVEGEKIISDVPPLEAGTIAAIAAGENRAYAAGEYGLLRYDRTATPKWTRFTLAAAGAAPSAGEKILSLSVDAASGRVYARTAAAVIVLEGDQLSRYAAGALSASDPGLLTHDRAGDVWVAQGSTLQRMTLGEGAVRVSFRENVLPWVEMYCSKCHQNQTQNFEDFAVFSEKAEQALTRVRSGDMPRCDGGLPCSEARLNPAEYSVLENWIRDGKAE